MRTHLAPAPLAFSLLTLLALTGVAQAATPPMRPGLWEVQTVSREMNGKPMPDPSALMAANMDKIPPEMRAQIEAQMKARGLQMGAAGGAPGSLRVCVSQDMINGNRWQQQHEGRCQHSGASQSGNTWTVSFTCQDPEAQGEVRTTFNGAESYSSDMTVTTQRKGKPTQMHMRHQAKWLGASCGDLKPMNAGTAPAKP